MKRRTTERNGQRRRDLSAQEQERDRRWAESGANARR